MSEPIIAKEITVTTRSVKTMFTREMIRDIYKLSGMRNISRKKSIEKILNSK